MIPLAHTKSQDGIEFCIEGGDPILYEILREGSEFRGYKAPCFERGGKFYFLIRGNSVSSPYFRLMPDHDTKSVGLVFV